MNSLEVPNYHIEIRVVIDLLTQPVTHQNHTGFLINQTSLGMILRLIHSFHPLVSFTTKAIQHVDSSSEIIYPVLQLFVT